MYAFIAIGKHEIHSTQLLGIVLVKKFGMATHNNYDLKLSYRQHPDILRRALQNMLLDQHLTDATLCCNGHKMVAHRLVLSAYSTFFNEIFRETAGQQPPTTVVLSGAIRPHILRLLLDFIYKGEVSISRENVDEFFAAAELLRIEVVSNMRPIKIEPTDEEDILQLQEIVEVGEPTQNDETAISNAQNNTTGSRANRDNNNKTNMKADKEKSVIAVVKEVHNLKRKFFNQQPVIGAKKMATTPIRATSSSFSATVPDNECRNKLTDNQIVRTNDKENLITDASKIEFNFFEDRSIEAIDAKPLIDISEVITIKLPDEDGDPLESSSGLMDQTMLVTESDLSLHGNVPPSSQKPYQCPDCNKSFEHPYSLIHHKMVHNGQTKCSICDQVLSRRYNLKMHLLAKHKLEI